MGKQYVWTSGPDGWPEKVELLSRFLVEGEMYYRVRGERSDIVRTIPEISTLSKSATVSIEELLAERSEIMSKVRKELSSEFGFAGMYLKSLKELDQKLRDLATATERGLRWVG